MARVGQEPAVGSVDGQRELLERSGQLAALAAALDAAVARTSGGLVLLGGEAGVGKTALLRAFCDDRGPGARVLWGACDGLLTPGPLGPFFDVAGVTRGELEELVWSGARPHQVTAALLRELAGGRPTVLVLEDLHWADEATLDVLRLLARRVETVPALVLASYRHEALDRAHPLTLVLGELATARAVTRMEVAPLSRDAVAELAGPHGVDADELYRQTSGNPFFVTEVLAGGTLEIPATVRDAVLARVARLSEPAQSLLEAIAIANPQAEIALLEALAPGELGALEECLASGMVAATPEGVAFRHELARLAVEDDLPPDRRVALHRAAAQALAAAGGRLVDHARIAHHAGAAGDGPAVLRHAPLAALRAAEQGAHREAAAQYARALRFAGALEPAEHADLLERRAYEGYLTGELGEAITAQEGALAHRRALGDPRRTGDCLRALSRLYRFIGRTAEAADVGRQAVVALESLAPGTELGLAYANLGHLHTVAEDADEASAWNARAHELGTRLDDAEVLVHALTNLGAVEVYTDAPGAPAALEESLALALREGLDEQAGRIYLNTVWWTLRSRRYDLVDRHLTEGLEYCAEQGLDLWRLFLIPCRARVELDRGRWAQAADSAGLAVRDHRTWPVPRIFALTVLALVRARRGDPQVWPLLDEALALARPSGELQRIGPVAAARAEAAWLEGRPEAVAGETEAALDLARRRRSRWTIGDSRVLELPGGRLRAGRRRGGRGALRRRARGRRRGGRGGVDRAGLPVRGRPRARRRRRRRRPAPRPGRAPAPRRPACGRDRRAPPARPRRARRPTRPARDDAGQPGGPDRPRGRGPRPRRRGPAQRRHRRAPLPLREDGRPSRVGDPAQARRPDARRGERRGATAGPGRAPMTLSVLAFCASALALVVSATGFYWQWLRVGKVSMIMGPDVRVDLDDYGLPRFLVQVVLMNDGARSVAVVDMRGSVSSQDRGGEARLVWASFERSRTLVPGEAGKEPTTPWEFDGRAEPIVIGARSSTMRTILFVCHGDYSMAEGRHRIRLDAIGGTSEGAVASFDDTIAVPSDVIAMLEQTTARGGVSQGTIVFRREGAGA